MRLTGACVASSMPSVSTVRLGAAEAGWCAVLRTDSIVEVAMADDGRERLYASIDCEWASSKSVVVDDERAGCLLQPGQDFDVLLSRRTFHRFLIQFRRLADTMTARLSSSSSLSPANAVGRDSAQTEDLTSACSLAASAIAFALSSLVRSLRGKAGFRLFYAVQYRLQRGAHPPRGSFGCSDASLSMMKALR